MSSRESRIIVGLYVTDLLMEIILDPEVSENRNYLPSVRHISSGEVIRGMTSYF